MLRILLIIVISYIVIRIALRLLMTESPSARRQRMNNGRGPGYGPFGQAGDGFGGSGSTRGPKQGRRRFEDIEDAEFEEIPDNTRKGGKEGKK